MKRKSKNRNKNGLAFARIRWLFLWLAAFVFYFFYQNDTYVLLHQFRKKSQKTPKREIEKAKTERNDYLRRKETAKL